MIFGTSFGKPIYGRHVEEQQQGHQDAKDWKTCSCWAKVLGGIPEPVSGPV